MPLDWSQIKVATSPTELTEASAARFGGAEIPEAKFAPSMETTVFPAAGGVIGGLMATPQLRGAGLGLGLIARGAGALSARAPQMLAPYVPSLFGSTIGTAAGTAAERAYEGDLFTEEGAKQMLGNLGENAAWDLGGNLVLRSSGKVLRIAKDKLPTGFSRNEIPDANIAAQKFLSERGATLSRGQLMEKPAENLLESIVREGTGAPQFARQEAGVRKAIESGRKEFLDSLNTSETFQNAMKSVNEPSVPAGEAIQQGIKSADDMLSAKVSPFYESLDERAGNIIVDISPLKKMAQAGLDKYKNLPNVIDPAEARVYETILQQGDNISFADAHRLRSSLKSAARNLRNSGQPSDVGEAAYNRFSNAIDGPMDKAFTTLEKSADKTKALELKKDYEATKNLYKNSMESLYSDTMQEVLKRNPERVGEYLFANGNVKQINDLYSAAAQMQTLGAKDAFGKPVVASNIIEQMKYGYVNKNLRTPEDFVAFNTKMKEDENFAKTFNHIFSGDQATFLKTMATAAEKGLTPVGGTVTALRTRQLGAFVGQGDILTRGALIGGGLGTILSLPSEAQERMKENLGTTALTGALAAGTLWLGPRQIAKALTNKETMDALVGLVKLQDKPAFGGAVAAKLIDKLNKTGIFDSEYINEVDQFFNRPAQQQPEGTAPQGKLDWSQIRIEQ